jgi:hypothetical protein
VNHKRLFRLYREERLMVRRRGGASGFLGTRAPMLVPIIGPLPAVNELIRDEVERRAYFADRFSAGWHTTLMIRH